WTPIFFLVFFMTNPQWLLRLLKSFSETELGVASLHWGIPVKTDLLNAAIQKTLLDLLVTL
ncbi:MAG: hypothetical protein AB7V04_06180, partial [Desulfomonilaceae bacterium]